MPMTEHEEAVLDAMAGYANYFRSLARAAGADVDTPPDGNVGPDGMPFRRVTEAYLELLSARKDVTPGLLSNL